MVSVSDTSSRKPIARMKPNEMRRARTNARQPRGMASRPPQTCCSALSSAANTVLAPTSSITTLTMRRPDALRATARSSHGREDQIGALLAEQQRELVPTYEYASSPPTIQPAIVTMMMSSGASENAQ